MKILSTHILFPSVILFMSMTDQEFKKLTEDEMMLWLRNEIWQLKQTVRELAEASLREELQLPKELKVKLTPRPVNRLGYGPLSRPLLLGEIQQARKETPSEEGASRWLGISYNTYKKWCRFYGVDIPGGRSNGHGIPKRNRHKKKA